MNLVLLLILAMPPQAPTALPPQAPLPYECPGAGCDCGCVEGNVCTCRAITAAGKFRVVRMATGKGGSVFVVSDQSYPLLTDSKWFNVFAEAKWEADRLNGMKTYSQWKAGLKRAAPKPGLMIRPSFINVSPPAGFFFGSSTGFANGGVACRGGG